MEESNLVRVENKIDKLVEIVQAIQEKLSDSFEFSEWEIVDEDSLSEEDLRLLDESRKNKLAGKTKSLDEIERVLGCNV